MRLRNKRGQSTLEYIILVTAVIAVLIIFLRPNDGVLVNTINTTYSGVTEGMETMANRLTDSWAEEEE